MLSRIDSDTVILMKRVDFLGDSLTRLRAFPEDARSEAGFQLRRLQAGEDPTDWKPMKSVGPGAREIRVREASGAFRIFYIANLPEGIFVLHAFQKKTQQTAQHDIDLAAKRLREIKP